MMDAHHEATEGGGGGVEHNPEDRGLGLLGVLGEDTKYPKGFGSTLEDALGI
jgi:hypothetical protein